MNTVLNPQKNISQEPQPSTTHRVLFATIVGAVLVAIAIFSVRGRTVTVLQDRNPIDTNNVDLIKNTLSANEAVKAKIDTDNDGLEDWEEALWGTDASKKDTDNDNTSDGDEIDQNRDPLTPGPNDVFADKEAIDKLRQENKKIENLTTTERFSRTLLAKYLLFKRNGLPLDEKSRDELIESTIESTGASIVYPKWKESDFSTITSPSTQQIRDYGNSLGRILLDNSPKNTENEIYLLAKIVSDEDYTDVPKLKSMADSYLAIIDAYKETPVPLSGIKEHTELMNALARMEADIRAFSEVEKDPIMILGYVGAHSDNVDIFIAALKASIAYFNNQNITYEQSEPGYAFTQSVR